jgi:acyl transferase domain-containing protein/thioesterase domain-containing protein
MMYNLVRNRDIMESVGAWLVRHNGNDTNFLATRVAYELNVTGPAMSVQTACSSSLAAVHLACQSLLSGECDMALAGGSTIYPQQDRGYLYKPGEILSPDGHCRAFDARAAGTVMASAVGCVILKRLEDALRDGDNVRAVIRGSAINNDGAQKVGYLAPSVSGQTRVIREALSIADVDAEDVSYIEAHGTGTLIGDPIEIAALVEAFRASTSKKQFCALGSLKSNIGHAGEAAGICGLIKTALALERRELPPSLHCEVPNPQIDFANSPFFVNDRLREWAPPAGKRRIAGVTALGAGGTNVHVLVEEAPEVPAAAPSRGHQLVAVSARTPAALDAAAKDLASYLRANPGLVLADVAHTLLAGRKGFACRRAVVARDALDAAAALESVDPKRSAIYGQKQQGTPSVVYMFPGGGAQYPRMGAELYDQEPPYREAFDACLSHLDLPLRDEILSLLLAKGSDEAAAGARLEAPSVALPAIFATEYALARLLASWGIEPAAMIGHSAGEYAAACLAGVLTPRDAMHLVALRGRLFETLPEGGMLSVALPEDQAREFLGAELSLAAVNAPSLCVLSGPVAGVARAEKALREREAEWTRVRIHVAAHCAMLDPILAEFERFCRTIRFQRPQLPFVSNLTGTWITDAEATDPTHWVRHLRSTVRFAAGVEKLLESPNRVLVEVGPGRTLASLARQQKDKPAGVATTLRHPQEEGSDVAFALATLARFWVSGLALDEKKLFAGEKRRRVSLPTYPFEGQRYWVDADPHPAAIERPKTLRKRADLRDWFYAPAWRSAAPPAIDAGGDATWLVFADASPVGAAILERLRRSGGRVVTVSPGERFAAVDDSAYTVSPSQRSDYDALAGELRSRGLLPDRVLHLWALGPRRSRLPRLLRRGARDAYSRGLVLDYFSLIFFAQAFAADLGTTRLTVVSSHMQALPGDAEVHAEKAVALGACKVIPREYPHVVCVAVDVEYPTSRREEEVVVAQIARELAGASADREVAYRGGGRLVRRIDPVPLESAPTATRTWLREGGVYLVTGGLGGIGLTVAEHLARCVTAKLVLVGRGALPEDEDAWIAAHRPEDETSRRIARVRSLRQLGAEVLTLAADVTDVEAMRQVRARTRARFGTLHGIFHVAGVLREQLIALRPSVARSDVLDVKMKGALVLDEVFGDMSLDHFVLFSSVSSVLGLPGQADYTAANSFLDAFAHGRAARGARGRTLSIDWNAWQDVGMLAARVRALANGGSAPVLRGDADGVLRPVVDDAAKTTFRATFRRSSTWMLGEHVVRGGEAVIPGTGLLEIARAALEHKKEARAVELRNVLFLSPFAVGKEQVRTLNVRIERGGDHAFVFYGESEDEPFVTGKAAYVDALPAARLDLDAVRARCPRSGEVENGFLVQPFIDLGARWGNLQRIALGRDEALLNLELPPAFAGDLEEHRLHPALLDMATGGAQALVEGFDPNEDFYVPFSYGRVLLREALPARVFSHIRLRCGARDTAVFDATLVDASGNEVASIESFVMRRVAPGAITVAVAAAAANGAASKNGTAAFVPRKSTPEEIALREGMTPAEGVEALERILANPFSAQVVACTVDLDAWLDKLEQEARASFGGPGPRAAVAGGPVFGRPNLGAAFVAPRNALEREIASMWSELLGVAEVGLDDDFFELGGQSLLAVRFFHRIERRYGLDLPIATLFQAPTVGQCAALLRERLGLPAGEERAGVTDRSLRAADAGPTGPHARAPGGGERSDRNDTGEHARPLVRSYRSVVNIRPGAGRIPFFCVHGAGGNVLNFRDLASGMDRGQPFFALQAYGIDGVTPPHETIEDMARTYLEEVRDVQPHGPYLLGGYSGGGVVAFEMAQQLTNVGEEVRLLAFIDTFHPELVVRRNPTCHRLARLRDEGSRYVVEVLRQRRDALRLDRHLRARNEYRSQKEAIPFALRRLYLARNFEIAVSRYRVKRWSGRATLFRAEQFSHLYDGRGPLYGWERDILGGVELVLVPGNHSTILRGANATMLLEVLNLAISRAQAGSPLTSRIAAFVPPAEARTSD